MSDAKSGTVSGNVKLEPLKNKEIDCNWDGCHGICYPKEAVVSAVKGLLKEIQYLDKVAVCRVELSIEKWLFDAVIENMITDLTEDCKMTDYDKGHDDGVAKGVLVERMNKQRQIERLKEKATCWECDERFGSKKLCSADEHEFDIKLKDVDEAFDDTRRVRRLRWPMKRIKKDVKSD